jgi:hypothetical protein
MMQAARFRWGTVAMFYWVNAQGRICLAAGAVLGFLGAGLGWLVGPYIGLGELGYVIGVAIGGLGIIAVDVGSRIRAWLNDECSLIGAFFWPSWGGTVNWFHASFDGLLFLGLGAFLIHVSWNIEQKKIQDAARRVAGQQEIEHLKRITQELPRSSIETSLAGNKEGIWTVTLTNKTGKTFGKVRLKVRAHYGSDFPQTIEWDSWKDGETKSFPAPGRGGMTDFAFEMEAYPPGADEPRFHLNRFGFVKKGKWEPAEPGS